jgi:hypothetical protein
LGDALIGCRTICGRRIAEIGLHGDVAHFDEVVWDVRGEEDLIRAVDTNSELSEGRLVEL